MMHEEHVCEKMWMHLLARHHRKWERKMGEYNPCVTVHLRGLTFDKYAEHGGYRWFIVETTLQSYSFDKDLPELDETRRVLVETGNSDVARERALTIFLQTELEVAAHVAKVDLVRPYAETLMRVNLWDFDHELVDLLRGKTGQEVQAALQERCWDWLRNNSGRDEIIGAVVGLNKMSVCQSCERWMMPEDESPVAAKRCVRCAPARKEDDDALDRA